MSNNFYVVEHRAKSAEIAIKTHKNWDKTMTPEGMAKMFAEANKQGFHCHGAWQREFDAKTGIDVMHCNWEVKNGVDVSKLVDFLDNHVMVGYTNTPRRYDAVSRMGAPVSFFDHGPVQTVRKNNSTMVVVEHKPKNANGKAALHKMAQTPMTGAYYDGFRDNALKHGWFCHSKYDCPDKSGSTIEMTYCTWEIAEGGKGVSDLVAFLNNMLGADVENTPFVLSAKSMVCHSRYFGKKATQNEMMMDWGAIFTAWGLGKFTSQYHKFASDFIYDGASGDMPGVHKSLKGKQNYGQWMDWNKLMGKVYMITSPPVPKDYATNHNCVYSTMRIEGTIMKTGKAYTLTQLFKFQYNDQGQVERLTIRNNEWALYKASN